MPVAGEPWRKTPSRLAGRPSRARVTPSRWRMRVIETVRKGRPIAQQAMAGCQRARMARRSNAEIRMRRTNHYAEAALAATASKSPTTGLWVDRDPLGFYRARMKHPSATHVQDMDCMGWFISSTDSDSLTADFWVTRVTSHWSATRRLPRPLPESAS